MKDERLHIVFKEHLQKEVENISNVDDLIDYLLEHNLFHKKTMIRYSLVRDVQACFKEDLTAKKTACVNIAAQKVGLSESQGWSILKNYQTYFD